jgi:hypothetical protein
MNSPEWPVVGVLIVLMIVFAIADCWAYTRAKWPERTRHWYYKALGGGFLALLKEGRDK